VVGEADDGEAALAMITALAPDVVVLDCQLPSWTVWR
jgi:CheY-like chemotaxis protein